MNFWDLGVKCSLSELELVAKIAENLGWHGIGICKEFSETTQIKEFKKSVEAVKKRIKIDLVPCIIVESSATKLKRSVMKIRGHFPIVCVKGGNYKTNAKACRLSSIDLLLNPGRERKDCGLDDACVKKAATNKVSIGLDFSFLLNSNSKARSLEFGKIREQIKLGLKYDAFLLITSGAKSAMELRAPRDLAAIGKICGMSKAIESIGKIPDRLIEKNRKKLSGKIKWEGVELVNE